VRCPATANPIRLSLLQSFSSWRCRGGDATGGHRGDAFAPIHHLRLVIVDFLGNGMTDWGYILVPGSAYGNGSKLSFFLELPIKFTSTHLLSCC
jgi:hypothetical protein